MSAHLRLPVGEGDHVRGDRDAAVVLVEYGDFECPHCGAAVPLVDTIREQMGTRLAFVYRHFPLEQVHPFAAIAAEGAEAAAAQGRFWEMHDVLFANQDALQPDDLVAYAEALGLDASRFADELGARTYAPHVQADVAGGVRSGVTGTPTFFINGLRYEGPRDLESMLEALERAAHSHRA